MIDSTILKPRRRFTDRISFRSLAVWCAALAFMIFILCQSRVFSASVSDALAYCIKTLIPAVFPFLVITGFLTDSGFADSMGRYLARPFARLFGVSDSAAAVFVMSLACGAPNGARCSAALYRDGRINKREAELTAAVSSGMSPAYLIAGVGSALYGDAAFGGVLWVSQVCAAIICGAVMRGKSGGGKYAAAENTPDLLGSLTSSIIRAGQSAVGICASVIFWSAVSTAVSIPLPDAAVYLRPLIEITSGLSCGLPLWYVGICCGFSGLAMITQSSAELKREGLSCVPLAVCRAVSACVCASAVVLLQ